MGSLHRPSTSNTGGQQLRAFQMQLYDWANVTGPETADFRNLIGVKHAGRLHFDRLPLPIGSGIKPDNWWFDPQKHRLIEIQSKPWVIIAGVEFWF